MRRTLSSARGPAILLTGVAIAALPSPAAACISGNETTFLLSSLPPLKGGDLLVEVEILSEPHVSPIQGRVVKVLAGHYSSDQITIARSSCDATRFTKGMRVVIAGNLHTRSHETLFLPFDERLSEPSAFDFGESLTQPLDID